MSKSTLTNDKKAAIVAMKDMAFSWKTLAEAFNSKFSTQLSKSQLQTEYKKIKQ